MKEKDLTVGLLLDFYGEMLTDRQREIIDYYYNEDLSLWEIAEHVGISRQGVRDIIKRGEAYLFELERKLGCAARHANLSGELKRISSVAQDIKFINSRRIYSMEIETRIDDIINSLQKLDI